MHPHIPGLMMTALLLLPGEAAAAAESAEPRPAPVWGYNMSGAGEDEGWSELSPEYTKCAYGDRQSPVMLADTKRSAMPAMRPDYHSSPISMEKKDRTIVIDVGGNNTLVDEGHSYKLVQIRIHTPAEHQFINALNPMELHFIHKDGEGKMLIMAVWGKRTETSHTGLQALLDKAPSMAKTIAKMDFDPASLLPVSSGYYAYTGSLSWPPCTEGVEWRVRKQPIGISKDQMKALGKLLGRNARLLQPPYMRTIRETIY